MSDKIKKILSGHSGKKSSRKSAKDGIECEEKGAQHHTGHAHHDPEIETKKATSAAGNFPYWGKKDGENNAHHADGADGAASGSKDLANGRKKQSSTSSGTSATGAGVAGEANGERRGSERRGSELFKVASRLTRKSSNTSSYPDGGTIKKQYSKEEAIIVAGAGVAGGSHLVDRARRNSRKSSNTVPVTKQRIAFTEENATPGTQTDLGATSSGDQHNHHHDSIPSTFAELERNKHATAELGTAGTGTDARIRHDECRDGEEKFAFTDYNSIGLTPAQRVAQRALNGQSLDDYAHDGDASSQKDLVTGVDHLGNSAGLSRGGPSRGGPSGGGLSGASTPSSLIDHPAADHLGNKAPPVISGIRATTST